MSAKSCGRRWRRCGGATPGVGAAVAPDVVWHLPGSSPIAGDVGPQAWADMLHRLLEAAPRPAPLATMTGDGHVAVLQHDTATSGEHGLDVQVLNVCSVVDGRVTRLDTYVGDQAAADTFWSAVL